MKVTLDRIKARTEQLRTQGFRIHGSLIRATLELNAGARCELSQSDAGTSRTEGADDEGPRLAIRFLRLLKQTAAG